MRPIKKLSFKRFERFNELLFRKRRVLHLGQSPYLYRFKYEIKKTDDHYEFSKNNGSFIESFFEIERKDSSFIHIKFRYITPLDPNKTWQNAYTTYEEDFKDSTNLLMIYKSIEKNKPVEISYVMEDFNDLMAEYVKFVEAPWRAQNESSSTGQSE